MYVCVRVVDGHDVLAEPRCEIRLGHDLTLRWSHDAWDWLRTLRKWQRNDLVARTRKAVLQSLTESLENPLIFGSAPGTPLVVVIGLLQEEPPAGRGDTHINGF